MSTALAYREAPSQSEKSPSEWRAMALRLQNKISNFYEENREMIRAGLDTGEVLLAAGTIGYVHGRKGYVPKVLGVPIDLGTFLVGKIGAFLMTAYKVPLAADVHALSNGPGAYYIGSVGADMGQRALRAAKNKDGTPEAKGRPLTDAEAKDLNADVRTIVAGQTKLLEAFKEEITQMRTSIVPYRQPTSAPLQSRTFY
jgi:hypothetical protein